MQNNSAMGKKLNIIIGIDTVNYNLKVMRIFGNTVSTAKVDYLPAPQEEMIKGEWAEVIARTLPEYMEAQKFKQSFAVWLVLPDCTVGTDLITIPAMKRANMQAAIETQLSALYPFFKSLKTNQFLLESNKTNATFEVVLVNKEILNQIYKALSECKLVVKDATYAASSALNAVFALRPKTKRSNFIFVDIKADSTVYTVCANGTTIGFMSLPYGHNILRSDKIWVEGNLFENDAAEIAVINATEKAKRKKMTMMDEDVIEDSAITVNEINADNEIDEETLEAMRLAANSDEIDEEDQTALVDALEAAMQVQKSEDMDKPVSLQQAVETPKIAEKLKTYVRKTKRLPAFMQREMPDTKEGIAAENFRLFVKHALILCQQNAQTTYLAKPEFILCNMPQEYGYIVDYLNEKDNSGIELRYFDPGKENNTQLTENLDLYGALFMGSFNKSHNF